MPEHNQEWINHTVIKVAGSNLAPKYMNAIVEVVVDTSLYLPAMCVLRFMDEDIELVDEGILEPGKRVDIQFGADEDSVRSVFKGEITAMEPEYTEELTMIFTVRGYDRSHRLNRGAKTRVFINSKDSDIVQEIAYENGLQPEVTATSQVFEHIFQDNQTDLAFLQERAKNLGFEVFVDDQKLYFRPPTGERGNVSLKWGETLHSFYPRMTLARQVDEVTVKGWDYSQKKEIIGKATNGQSPTRIANGQNGGSMAQSAFSAANHIVVRHPVVSQAQADSVAQATLNNINAEFVEAEGVALGNPELVAGKIIAIENLGRRFSGDYMVTSAVHVYAKEGYEIQFRVEGAYTRMMADLVNDSGATRQDHKDWSGVFVGIVTNNKDPQDMGRVKLKFPWLDNSLEGGWARLVGIGAGDNRGIFWLPEVNDEVLVAFEHGDFNHPYVIGSVWNGKDKPPETSNDAVKSGKVEVRTIKTRSGHFIKLSDESGNQFIEIKDSDGSNQIKLDTKNKKLIVKTTGDVEMESTGKTTIKSTSDVAIEGSTNVNIKASANISIEANASLTIKGTGNVSVESSGSLSLRGSVVRIN